MANDDPDDLHDVFMAQMEAYESTEPQDLFDALQKSGISLPAPEDLDDAALAAKLWEVIHGLSLLGTFLHSTNHLSDRELYAVLWKDLLREPAVLMPENPDFAYHLDVIGSGSEEDTLLYLKYYADEETRQDWLKDLPKGGIPEHEDPPDDRDRRLPQAEARRDGLAM